MQELFNIFNELQASADKADYESMMAADKRLRQAVEAYFSDRESLQQSEKAALQSLLQKHDDLIGKLQKQKSSVAQESQSLQRSARAKQQYVDISLTA